MTEVVLYHHIQGLTDGVLAFARDPRFVCVANLSTVTVDLPDHEEVWLSSGPLDGDRLPADTTAWLRTV